MREWYLSYMPIESPLLLHMHVQLIKGATPLHFGLKLHLPPYYICIQAGKALERLHICTDLSDHPLLIGIAQIKHLRRCVMKIVTFKGGHLMW